MIQVVRPVTPNGSQIDFNELTVDSFLSVPMQIKVKFNTIILEAMEAMQAEPVLCYEI